MSKFPVEVTLIHKNKVDTVKAKGFVRPSGRITIIAYIDGKWRRMECDEKHGLKDKRRVVYSKTGNLTDYYIYSVKVCSATVRKTKGDLLGLAYNVDA